ncbi:MAG: hypothetical protein R3E21_08010 [Caenibius sp.]
MRRHSQFLTRTAGLIATGALAFSAMGAAYASQPTRPAEPVNDAAAPESANPLYSGNTKTHESALYKARDKAAPAPDGTSASGDDGAGGDPASNQRIWPFKGKKLKKLPHDLDTTLDPMDETDPCPTLSSCN